MRWERIGVVALLAAGLAACGDRQEAASPATPSAAPAAAPAVPGGPSAFLSAIGPRLVASDGRKAARIEGDRLFAHAPMEMKVVLDAPVRLRGVAGMLPQPEGTPPGDGVLFKITETPAGGAPKVLFETTVAANGPAAPFDVQLAQGSTLQLETRENASTDFDWAYWGQLEQVP